MNILNDLRDSIPSGERLYKYLAGIMIFFVLLGYVIFISNSLLPTLRYRTEVAEGFTNAQQDLINVQLSRENAEESLHQQIVVAQSALEQAATNLMNQTQATRTLENIYIYAANNNVIITDLRTLPAGEKDANIPIDTSSFVVEIEGSIPNLLSFIASIQETTHKSFIVDSVYINEGEVGTILTMNITILTSPYAPGTTGTVSSLEAIGEGAESQGEEPQKDILPTPIIITHEILENQLHAIWSDGDWPAAIEILEQLIAIKPGDNEVIEKLYAAHVNYGYLFMSANQPENAQIQFDLALAIKPDGKEAQAGLQASTGAQASEPQFTTHIVQAGETLYSIGRKYGSKVEAIKLANDLPDNNIKVGQVLTIPLQ